MEAKKVFAEPDRSEVVSTTCASLIGDVCTEQRPSFGNSQLCVLSVGFDLEGVAAALLWKEVVIDPARIFCVVLPDNLPGGTITTVASALEAQLCRCRAASLQKKNKGSSETVIDVEGEQPEEEEKRNADSATAHTTVPRAASPTTMPASSSSPATSPASTGALPPPPVVVHVIEEGTSTRERCEAFQRGGVVVTASRMLCADLLHRRLLVDLVAMALLLLPRGVVGTRSSEVVTPSFAFSVEVLLRGGSGGGGARQHSASPGRSESARKASSPVMTHTHPAVVLLSDHPTFVQYLVQRHHVGLERFTHLMHIGDIQLFPRFRLSFVRHFEKLAQEKPPLTVDRLVVNVSTTAQVLDDLLQKVLLEVLRELQSFERRTELAAAAAAASSGGCGGSEADATASSAPSTAPPRASSAKYYAEMDEETARFQPRSRPRYDAKTGQVDYGGYGRGNATLKSAGSTSATYVRKAWRHPSSLRLIQFRNISEEVCLDVFNGDLSVDLANALRANEPSWSYRPLVESLLDLRHLRHTLRTGSAYDFVFALEAILERRTTPQLRGGGAPAVPSAMWTLSTHFNDIVTVATHRIGETRTIECDEWVEEEEEEETGESADTTEAHDAVHHDDNPVVTEGTATPAPPGVIPAAVGTNEQARNRAVTDVSEEERNEDSDDEVTFVSSTPAKNGNATHAAASAAPPPSLSVPTRKLTKRVRRMRKVARLALVPNAKEVDNEVEVVHRLVCGWCRDTLRRAARGGDQVKAVVARNAAASSSSSALPAGPVMGAAAATSAVLVLVTGQRALIRLVERLTHSAESYQRLQLNHFLGAYQAKYGIRLTSTGTAAKALASASRPTALEERKESTAGAANRAGQPAAAATGGTESAAPLPASGSLSSAVMAAATTTMAKSDTRKRGSIAVAQSVAEWLANSSQAATVALARADADGIFPSEDVDDMSGMGQRGGLTDGSEAVRKAGRHKRRNTVGGTGEGSDHDSRSTGEDEGEEEEEDDAESTARSTTSQSAMPSALFTQSVPSSAQDAHGARSGSAAATAFSLHQVLLTQPPLPIAEEEEEAEDEGESGSRRGGTGPMGLSHSRHTNGSVRENSGSGAREAEGGPPAGTTAFTSATAITRLMVERLRGDIAVLVPKGAAEASTVSDATHPRGADPGRAARVVIVDSTHLRTADLLALLEGTHPVLCVNTAVAFASTSTPPPPRANTNAEESGREDDTAVHATVRRIILTQQTLPLLRALEMAQDELAPNVLAGLKVQLLCSSVTDADFTKVVQREREAFEALAHAKATLTGTMLADRASLRQTEEILQSGLLLSQTSATGSLGAFGPSSARITRYARISGRYIGGPSNEQLRHPPAPPLIVFDEREFRSSLPYALYSRGGIDLIPLTITVADYVLSPQYAVERKSVPDFTQSLQSGRIQHQMAAMARRYEHPICLIEFSRTAPFRLTYSTAWRSTTDTASMGVLYARATRLIAANPRASFVWSRSAGHSAGMLATLKHTVARENVDPSDPALTRHAVDLGDDGVGGGRAGGKSSELSHYAARVLSRFPGVTPENAPRVMQLCGSLSGLATIARSSLVSAIGEENGAVLYQFLHHSFAEDVG